MREASGFHVDAKAPVGNGGHDGGGEIADGAVFANQLFQLGGVGALAHVDVTHRAAPTVPAVILDQADADRAYGICLQASVDRGVNLVAGVLRPGTESLAHLEPCHLRDVRRFDVVEQSVLPRRHGILVGGLGSRGVDVTELAHAAQYV